MRKRTSQPGALLSEIFNEILWNGRTDKNSPSVDQNLDGAWVEVDTNTTAKGAAGNTGAELGAEGTATTMGLGHTAPDGTSVAAAGRGLVPADATLGLVAVVDVAAALAGVERGIVLAVNVVDAEDRLLVVLLAQTTAVVGQHSLHVEAGATAVAADEGLLATATKLADLLLAAGSDAVEGERVALHAARGLLDADLLLSGHLLIHSSTFKGKK